MRVKLIIALAIASILLLAGTLPAGAVEGVTGVGGININVPTPIIVPPVIPSTVVPCVAFLAVEAPVVVLCPPANQITLGGPALAATITLFGPQVPSFAPPNFVLPQLSPPVISPFVCTAPIFDP